MQLADHSIYLSPEYHVAHGASDLAGFFDSADIIPTTGANLCSVLLLINGCTLIGDLQKLCQQQSTVAEEHSFPVPGADSAQTSLLTPARLGCPADRELGRLTAT